MPDKRQGGAQCSFPGENARSWGALGEARPGQMLRGSQAPRRAVCGTRGSLRTMHGGGSAPSCCAFTNSMDMSMSHLREM